MYKFYKGESDNPFDHETQNTQHMFWFYESIFERDFISNDSPDWFAFFGDNKLGQRFMKLLSEEDYERPTEAKKKPLFELWLDYLFTEKLTPDYGGDNPYKKAYFSTPDR